MCFLFYVGNLLTQENIAEVLTEVSPLIGDGDLHISQVRIALVRPLQALGPNSRNARGGLRDRDSSGCEKSQVWPCELCFAKGSE